MDDEPRPLGRPEPDAALERMLEAYADARLAPDPDRLARMRVELMNAASERMAAPNPVIPGPAQRRGLLARLGLSGGGAAARPHRSRLVPALLAASLAVLLLGGVAYAGSQAGGPLYPARIWLENATLPSEPAARVNAELGHLQARLDDAAGAAASGNVGAVQAALDAYQTTADQAAAAADGNPVLATHLGSVLGRQEAVLGALLARLPPQAAAAIQRVIDRTEQKIQQVQGSGPGSQPGPGAKPGSGSQPGSGTQPGAGSTPTPADTGPKGRPDRSPPAGGPSGNGHANGHPGEPTESPNP
jgi:hypothetical protein